MFNISKKITAAIFTLGMMVPVTASANFYVIPVGQSPIKASNAKSFQSSCVVGGQNDTIVYTVPENKIFVVTSFMVHRCEEVSSYPSTKGILRLGSKLKIIGPIENDVKNFNMGIILDEGETIELSNAYSNNYASYGVQVNINGYLANP